MSIVVGAAGCWSGVESGVVSGVSSLMARLSINGGLRKLLSFRILEALCDA
jgi:hypothetical protein